VRADGVMVPCSMLAHMEMGRINEDSLVDTWRNSPVLRQLRARHDIPLSRFAFCEGCPYTLYCTGNCPGLSYTLVGEVDHPSPDACLRAFLAQGGRIVEP
jgi:radical SAM protein with 4Fe4S-binding SPASM domain